MNHEEAQRAGFERVVVELSDTLPTDHGMTPEEVAWYEEGMRAGRRFVRGKRERDPESTRYFLIVLLALLFAAMLTTIFALLFGAWVWLIFAGFAIIPTVALIFLSIEGVFGSKR